MRSPLFQLLETFNAMYMRAPLPPFEIHYNLDRGPGGFNRKRLLDAMYSASSQQGASQDPEGVEALTSGEGLQSLEPIEIDGSDNVLYLAKLADGREIIVEDGSYLLSSCRGLANFTWPMNGPTHPTNRDTVGTGGTRKTGNRTLYQHTRMQMNNDVGLRCQLNSKEPL